ncbi:MAG: hypothetical protein KGI78_04445 [Patescibacteria group bacterium]|nr:hypothetical protein [Patescibacteria group bacterium]MDE1944590.1 hypothetical protein [Patescibacteria group bacterium]MDE1945422.1 hypothetical protein [Patescibacteria group bacterium]MDE2058060.1 hypothetical protein [Patescibacteria group bacterium]
MTPVQRQRARAYANFAAGKIPNSSTSGDLYRAAEGDNDDLLLAIHLILEYRSTTGEFAMPKFDQSAPREEAIRTQVQACINDSRTIHEARGRIAVRVAGLPCVPGISAVEVRDEGNVPRVILRFSSGATLDADYEPTFKTSAALLAEIADAVPVRRR